MEKVFSRVFLKNVTGDILIIKDRETMWNIPGGKQEAGESPIDCAIREVHEEIALVVSNLEEIYCDDFMFGDTKWKGHFYFAGVATGIPTLNEPDKIKGLQFIKNLELVNFSASLEPLFTYLSESNTLMEKKTSWR
ncbi:MAG: NUDIX hydrolase [Lactovum sp.]